MFGNCVQAWLIIHYTELTHDVILLELILHCIVVILFCIGSSKMPYLS
jgi:hypothetical protein